MDVLLELHEKARRLNARVVLPEANDERIVQAAAQLSAKGLCQPVLVESRGMGDVPPGVETVRPSADPRTEQLAAHLLERRQHKGMTEDMAREMMLDVSYFGTMMVYKGLADGMVSGAAHTTGHTIRPALEFVRTRPSALAALGARVQPSSASNTPGPPGSESSTSTSAILAWSWAC